MGLHESLGGHRYVSFGLCFPSRHNATVLSQHLAPVCMRPVGPPKCTGFLFTLSSLLSGPSNFSCWHPDTTGPSDRGSLHVWGYKNTKRMCTLSGISPRRDSLNSCNVATFRSLCACLVELYCRTKLRHHAPAAGCMEFLHLVLWWGGGEESQSL